MAHYLLQPEVAGGHGKRTVVDRNVGQPSIVTAFHCVLEGWRGDDLVESFPCFLVTEALGAALVTAGLSGFDLDDVEVTTTADYKAAHPGQTPPKFRWLKVSGTTSRTDFWMENDQSLAVSARAWEFLKVFRLQHCSVRRETGRSER